MAEIDIQAKFRGSLRYVGPSVQVVAVPNAGKRTLWQQRQVKKEGLSAGFPDCICIWPGGICFVEFKSPKGRISENQREWLDRLSGYGFMATVARSVDEALDFLRECGAPVGRRAA